ncbi:putative quinol monooxygenase [Pseudofrankia asymbiotica]|uniref:ABM domain-containing protein n=1 Tax=Pseudofrankia asymbiotica TaxID=1834516 RepID=A0A1V2I8K8_9ACTN|nr:putative quinol monooxygenase [Pseudofrankia asymbiotica]ONH28031.1 hypothetical protein BL253_20735 [Pseudofrankia asymbiotica]
MPGSDGAAAGPVAIVATLTVLPGTEDEAADILRQLVAGAGTEPGALAYTVVRLAAESRQFLVYEQYVDEPARLAHRETEAFRAWQPKLAALLDGRPHASHGEVLASTGDARAASVAPESA